MLRRLTRSELRLELGLGDGETPAVSGLMALTRMAVARWELAARPDVLRYLRKQLAVCGWATSDERAGLHVDARDCVRVWLEGTECLLPAPLRLVQVGDRCFLSGAAMVEPELQLALGWPGGKVVRWLDPAGTRLASLLEELEVIDLRDWLGGTSLATALARREVRQQAAAGLWERVLETLGAEGFPAADNEAYRVLGGAPGGFFGSVREPSGRWRPATQVGDGVWCAARAGHTGEHTGPCVVAVKGGQVVQALDVYDWDELLWLIYGRGVTVGQPEKVVVDRRSVRLSAPLPKDLWQVLGVLLAPGERGWWWEAPSEASAVEVGRVLAELLGDWSVTLPQFDGPFLVE